MAVLSPWYLCVSTGISNSFSPLAAPKIHWCLLILESHYTGNARESLFEKPTGMSPRNERTTADVVDKIEQIQVNALTYSFFSSFFFKFPHQLLFVCLLRCFLLLLLLSIYLLAPEAEEDNFRSKALVFHCFLVLCRIGDFISPDLFCHGNV